MGARIGDILAREGLVTIGDIQEALALARRDPMRLASALVTLGRVSIDDASRALAEQHGVPAALEKHLAGRDLALAELVPAALARELGALPLAVQRSEGALVVCVRDPAPAAKVRLELATGRTVVLAVAVEVALWPRIDETYPADRAPSESGIPFELEVDLDTGPATAAQAHALDVDSLHLVDLDDARVAKDHSASDPQIRLPAFRAAPAIAPPRPLALDPAIDAIRAAGSRGQVVDAIVAFLRHWFAAGVVFVVEHGVARGQAGFGSEGTDQAVASLAVPLARPSPLRIAFDQQASFLGPPGDSVLSGATPALVVVVPVVIEHRVVHLLYAHGARGAADEAATELATIAEVAADALVRIIQKPRR